jgi:membrane fusion protein, multidrug efflux system
VANQGRTENAAEVQTPPLPTTQPQSDEAREPWPEETEQAPEKKGFFAQHPHARWLILFVLIALAVVGTLVWRYYSAHESTDDAQIDGHIGPISARVTGTVLNVYADNNDFVRAGQVLVQLDPKDYQVALDHAKADLADLEASAAGARTGVPITSTTTSSSVLNAEASVAAAHQQVDAAQARSREAEANYTKVAADLKRAQMLVSKDEISQQQYDAAVASEKASAATVEAAHSSVAATQAEVRQAEAVLRSAKTAPQQLQVMQSRASAAEAAAQRAKATVAQAELNLQYCTIRAPYDGILSNRNVQPGQVLQIGAPAFAIVNIDKLWVTANFKETQLHYMRPGQAAIVHVDAYNHDYKGHVDSIGGATGSRFSLLPPENATGNYVKVVQRIPVRILIDKGEDPNHVLRPGMSVEPMVTLR